MVVMFHIILETGGKEFKNTCFNFFFKSDMYINDVYPRCKYLSTIESNLASSQ